jgi:predicted dehydrogenase
MEKQFARTAADLQPLATAVQQNGVKVLANYPWPWHPAVRTMKGLLADEKLGRPLALHAQLVTTQVRPGLRNPHDLAYRDDTEGGGILHMEGGHWLEAMRFLMGCEVAAVTAVCRPVVGFMAGQNMDDVSVLGLEFANGAVGMLHVGYLEAMRGPTQARLGLWGSEGSVRWEMGAPNLFARSNLWGEPAEREMTVDLPNREGVYGGQEWLFEIVQDFIHAIREDRQPAVTAEDAFRVLQVIDAAYESSHTGRRVELRYDDAPPGLARG